jgi:lipid A ethanolaminephosphotransferase
MENFQVVRYSLSGNQVVLGGAFFTTVFANFAFFRNLYQAFAGQPWGYAHIASLAVVLFCTTVVLLALLSLSRAIKPVFALYFLLAAATAYFMDSYNVIIDHDMINNVVLTDPAEALDLLTGRMVAYLLLLGVLPVVALRKVEIRRETVLQMLRNRGLLIAAAVLVAVGLALLSSGFYASFIREHKPLRYYTNPAAPLQGAVRYASIRLKDTDKPLTVIGQDARVPAADTDRELVIMVVGETARSDRFSLNGYSRETTPMLAREKVASLRNVWSCGTSTAVSVPCMFAIYNRDRFSGDKARNTENLLDVLQHAGVTVLWRDNNSDSKGVARRVPFEDFRSPDTNPVCDLECRDEGMLEGLQSFIDGHPSGDILVVLHHMGSHGPAYHKRYPADFRRFTPTCDTSQLDACSEEQIGNSYDNTLLYTDYFLSKVISLLRDNDEHFETAMIYASDHGESLGEGGLYLHGLPYFVAPEAQTHVPMVFWFGHRFDGARIEALRQLADRRYSHDNLFHTLLGLFEIETDVYQPNMDILREARMLEGGSPEYH